MVVVKFLVFVSEVVSIFSQILTWIIGGGAKGYLCPPTQLLGGGACPGCPPKSTPMIIRPIRHFDVAKECWSVLWRHYQNETHRVPRCDRYGPLSYLQM